MWPTRACSRSIVRDRQAAAARSGRALVAQGRDRQTRCQPGRRTSVRWTGSPNGLVPWSADADAHRDCETPHRPDPVGRHSRSTPAPLPSRRRQEPATPEARYRPPESVSPARATGAGCAALPRSAAHRRRPDCVTTSSVCKPGRLVWYSSASVNRPVAPSGISRTIRSGSDQPPLAINAYLGRLIGRSEIMAEGRRFGYAVSENRSRTAERCRSPRGQAPVRGSRTVIHHIKSDTLPRNGPVARSRGPWRFRLLSRRCDRRARTRDGRAASVVTRDIS